MSKNMKYERQNKINRIIDILFSQDMVAEDWIKVRDGESFSSALKRINKNKEDMYLGSDKIAYNDAESFCRYIDGNHITLARIVSMDDITKAGVVWKDLSLFEKKDVLHTLGLNVMGDSEQCTRYLKKGLHRTLQGNRSNSIYFVANERTDKEWLNSGNASYEAKIWSEDNTLMRELSGLSKA